MLQQKLPNNKCDGSFNGVQYFNCLPGFGIFTSIEKLSFNVSNNFEQNTSPKKSSVTDLDASAEKNISHFSNNFKDINMTSKNLPINRTSNYFKSSRSMQDICEANSKPTVNTNNDFDQNTILQPDKSQLITNNHNVAQVKVTNNKKSDVDLTDVIGDMWTKMTDSSPSKNSLAHLKRSSLDMNLKSHSGEKSTGLILNNDIKTMRNKSANPISHIINGSKTVPRKRKCNQERQQLTKDTNMFVSTKNIDIFPSK